ncbi:MAG TPA: hypothetical protein VG014_07500 [Acidimicrobiales bacterium]|nr:hypothetical protein [Acidimicrobiales bacterium]
MTIVRDAGAPAPVPVPVLTSSGNSHDRRGSWIPTGGMIATRFMELRKRRGLMIVLLVVNIGIPSVFLLFRLLAHAFAPNSYGPAGGYDIFTNLVAGVMYVFGFIVAATLGCTAGSVDLTEGMFRHLVVTGRSRLALYLARIPAGLAIILPMVAVGFAIVCTVCVAAAPTSISYQGTNIPAGLSLTGFEAWAGNHPDTVICNFPTPLPPPSNVNCGNGPGSGPVGIIKGPQGAVAPAPATPAAIRAEAVQIAQQNYNGYKQIFLYPSNSLMIKAGLWIELEAGIGFIVGLGLASLLGQRTVSVILMIVLEVILTPLLSRHVIPHFLNLERAMVGLATAHLEPGGLPLVFGGGGGGGPGGVNPSSLLVPETTTVAVCVIIGWLVVWTALGAWRMMTRDA